MDDKNKDSDIKNDDGLCHPDGCPFFSLEPEIFEDKIIDGVRQRKVRRICLYDLSVINSWRKQCPRYCEARRRKKNHGGT